MAIKTLLNEQIEANRDAFLNEAELMMKLDHHCVVKLVGLSLGPPLCMVQELIALGSMLAYITTNQQKINPNYEFKLWAAQIACGKQRKLNNITVYLHIFFSNYFTLYAN